MNSYNDFAMFYNRLTENIDYAQITNYYDKLIAKFGSEKGILLDLACGTGTTCRLFSEMGYDVIGVDGSEDMLNIASKNNDGTITYLCQDMCELDLYGTIDQTVCSLDSINHLDGIDEVQQTFNRVSLFTYPGGLFLFDMNTVYKHKNILGDNTFVYDLDDLYCVWQNELDTDNRVNIFLDFFVKENGAYQRYEDDFSEQAYNIYDIEKALNRAGFEVLACYDYLTENEPTNESEKVTFVCRECIK